MRTIESIEEEGLIMKNKITNFTNNLSSLIGEEVQGLLNGIGAPIVAVKKSDTDGEYESLMFYKDGKLKELNPSEVKEVLNLFSGYVGIDISYIEQENAFTESFTYEKDAPRYYIYEVDLMQPLGDIKEVECVSYYQEDNLIAYQWYETETKEVNYFNKDSFTNGVAVYHQGNLIGPEHYNDSFYVVASVRRINFMDVYKYAQERFLSIQETLFDNMFKVESEYTRNQGDTIEIDFVDLVGDKLSLRVFDSLFEGNMLTYDDNGIVSVFKEVTGLKRKIVFETVNDIIEEIKSFNPVIFKNLKVKLNNNGVLTSYVDKKDVVGGLMFYTDAESVNITINCRDVYLLYGDEFVLAIDKITGLTEVYDDRRVFGKNKDIGNCIIVGAPVVGYPTRTYDNIVLFSEVAVKKEDISVVLAQAKIEVLEEKISRLNFIKNTTSHLLGDNEPETEAPFPLKGFVPSKKMLN